jgi:hypothetical protein
MGASPRRSLNRANTKFGFPMHSLVCLGIGLVVAFTLPQVTQIPLPLCLAIGISLGLSLGLTIGRGTAKIHRSLYKPPSTYTAMLPNTHTTWIASNKNAKQSTTNRTSA